MSGLGWRLARPLGPLLRVIHGWLLRWLPRPAAAWLRGMADRHAWRLGPTQPDGGRRIPVPGLPAHPVVLVVALGSDTDRLATVATHLRDCPIRAVWAVDADDPRAVGEAVVEWVPRADGLTAQGLDADRIRAARLALLRARYRPRLVVMVAPEGPLPDRALLTWDLLAQDPSA